VVVPRHDDVLVATIDALGHGPEAARVASRAADCVREHATNDLRLLLERCHAALRGSRGVALSAAYLDAAESSLSWVGVGNVEAALLRAVRSVDRRDESLCSHNGVVGYRLPRLRVRAAKIARGDLLVMVTDGIRSGFRAGVIFECHPSEIAERVLEDHLKGTDDALVFVGRWSR
jgi:hypothetical protein